jgi:hypothetical protein
VLDRGGRVPTPHSVHQSCQRDGCLDELRNGMIVPHV